MVTNIQIQIDGQDEPVEVSLDLAALTMRESVWLEEMLGADGFDQLAAGEGFMRPSVIRAILYVKLRSMFPDLSADGFDVDLSVLTEALDADPKS